MRRILITVLVLAVAAALGALLFAPKLSTGNESGCGTVDLALNRPATASSLEGTGFPASNAVDGDIGTRWGSEFADPQWLQVDLGDRAAVCGVTIHWETAHATAFRIQVSDDAANWSDVYSTTDGTGGTQTISLSGTGRYIRMYGTARSGQYGYSIWEFDVYASSTSHASISAQASAASSSAGPVSAPANVPAGGSGVILGTATGLCVDSDGNPAVTLNGTPLGGHAFATACSGASSQLWQEGPPTSLDPSPDATWYRLLDQQTGFCLDGNRDGNVYTLPCLNPDNFQLWQRVANPTPASSGPTPSGTLVAYRSFATQRCLSLAASDKTLRALPCPTGNTWPPDMLFQR